MVTLLVFGPTPVHGLHTDQPPGPVQSLDNYLVSPVGRQSDSTTSAVTHHAPDDPPVGVVVDGIRYGLVARPNPTVTSVADVACFDAVQRRRRRRSGHWPPPGRSRRPAL